MRRVKYRRKNRGYSAVEALVDAQKIVFSPMIFQTIGTMLDLGILKLIDKKPVSANLIMEKLQISEYAVNTILESAQVFGVVDCDKEGLFSVTKLGKSFLYDQMTIVNFNFIRNCCYLGASEMTESFLREKPMGLKKFYKDGDTLYPLLPQMSEIFKKSWYEFDNYYSDNCFEEVYNIIASQHPEKFFDIGGNTGGFEKVCLVKNPNIDISMLDLKANIEVVSKNSQLKKCKFYSVNMLEEEPNLPKISGAVLMSQFLDCFSKAQIKRILENIKKSADKETKVYILEPFTDNQYFEASKLSLIEISLYFTCMANGNSKMYKKSEMIQLVKDAGLEVSNIYENIGTHEYTLLECSL